VSDRNGVYTFNSLKAGTYRAYVGCWKNPTWFNRCTPPVTVGKDRAQAPDMALCMIIEGVSPRIGDRCRLGDLQLSWTPCSAAQTYDVGVMDTTTRQGVFASWDTPATTSVTVPRDKLLAGHSYVCSVRAYNSAKEEIAGTAGCPANRLWTFSVK
jgi:hypothetical protein